MYTGIGLIIKKQETAQQLTNTPSFFAHWEKKTQKHSYRCMGYNKLVMTMLGNFKSFDTQAK